MLRKWSLQNEDTEKSWATITYDYETDQWETQIPDGITADMLPPILRICYFQKGENPIGNEHTHWFIEERIPPRDRQNIVDIMKEAGMFCYDEAKLIDAYGGKAAQDRFWMKILQ